jgi:DNA-binding transcriptional LysR family regulator
MRLQDSSLTVRRLGSDEIRYYAAPAYLARRGEPRSAGDPKHEWVTFSAAQARRPKHLPRVCCDDFFLIRDLLREGLGVGPLPAILAGPYVRSGALVPVLASERQRGPGGYFLLYPSSGQVPRKVIALRDFLVEHLKTHPLG